MSLINKMLQDLDARGSQPGAALPSDVRAAGPVRRQLPVRRIAVATSVVVIGVALAVVFWLKRPVPVPAPPVVVLVPKVVAPPVALVPPAAPVVAAAVNPAVAAAVAPEPAPAVAPVQPAPPVAAPTLPLGQGEKMTGQPDPTFPVAAAPVRVAAAPRAKLVRVAANDEPQVRLARAARVAAVAEEPRLPVPVSAGGRDMTSAQRAEAHYRNALAALEEGRMAAAFDALEQALKLNPRHDAARQSLAALLIEAGRNDEAMQQLEQGLAIDPAQPSMAMLLARMQIERGNSGVATLLRTLPAATGNGDYHAFLAGALQRESRHREAAEQYGAALRTMPEHGVWLMGLGISLQADKRERDALAAFQRAKASGTLTPPLQAFVERKILQLTP